MHPQVCDIFCFLLTATSHHSVHWPIIRNYRNRFHITQGHCHHPLTELTKQLNTQAQVNWRLMRHDFSPTRHREGARTSSDKLFKDSTLRWIKRAFCIKKMCIGRETLRRCDKGRRKIAATVFVNADEVFVTALVGTSVIALRGWMGSDNG